jgi:hypothetical protein
VWSNFFFLNPRACIGACHGGGGRLWLRGTGRPGGLKGPAGVWASDSSSSIAANKLRPLRPLRSTVLGTVEMGKARKEDPAGPSKQERAELEFIQHKA